MNPPFTLIQRAKANARNEDWLEKLSTDSKPKALIGVIAAGEKVVASKHNETYERLTKLYSDALAVEMEGIGFLTAIHANNAKGIVIRGISDLLSKKTASDSSGWQEKAAHHAAAFAFGILDKLANQSSETKIKSKDAPMQSLIDLMQEKLVHLEKALILETNAAVKFQLKNEIAELQQEIERKKQ